MAILYPPHPQPGTPYSEILVRESLQRLADDWKVFHSVAWQSVRNGRQSDGVADFILLHPNHGLCLSEMAKAALPIPREPTVSWWEYEAPESLATAAQRTGTSFDAIIVDEGQDFSEDWLTALSMLTPDRNDTPFYVFADSHQECYARNWGVPSKWPTIPLDINCRNTNQIA